MTPFTGSNSSSVTPLSPSACVNGEHPHLLAAWIEWFINLYPHHTHKSCTGIVKDLINSSQKKDVDALEKSRLNWGFVRLNCEPSIRVVAETNSIFINHNLHRRSLRLYTYLAQTPDEMTVEGGWGRGIRAPPTGCNNSLITHLSPSASTNGEHPHLEFGLRGYCRCPLVPLWRLDRPFLACLRRPPEEEGSLSLIQLPWSLRNEDIIPLPQPSRIPPDSVKSIGLLLTARHNWQWCGAAWSLWFPFGLWRRADCPW